MTTPDTTATFRLTEQDALDASRLVSYRMLHGSCFYLLTVVFTLALCVVAFAEGRIWGVILIGILVLVPLAYVVSWKLIVPSRMRRHYRQTAAQHDETCLSWDEDSLTFTSPRGHVKFLWRDFHGWTEGERLLILFQSELYYNALPKSAFSSAALENFRARLVSAGVPKRR